MKVNIEIDLTPKEARELMGWPDTSEFQGKLMDAIQDQLEAGDSEHLNPLIQPYLAESQKSFAAYQKLMEGFLNANETKK